MKKLVIFYSFTGNTKLIAENIAEAIDADILELKPKKEIKSEGFMKYFQAGKEVIMKSKPELLPLDKNPEDYDVLFVGTPVWARSCPPVLNSFLSAHPLSEKKIALFCCHGGGKGNIFGKMKEALKNNWMVGEIDFQEPLKKNRDNNIQKARKWAENIVNTL